MALDIVAIITAAPGKEAEVEKVLNELAAGVKENEPKTQRYKPYKVVSKEEGEGSKFIMIERYPDQAGLDAHQATEHYKAAIKKGTDGEMLSGMTVHTLEAMSEGFDSR